MPDPGSAAPATREQVFAWMAETGSTARVAAESWGLNFETVKSWVKRHGDPRRGGAPEGAPLETAPDAAPLAAPLAAPPAPARVAPAPPAPKPRKPTAADLPPDDRAELVALVRELTQLLVSLKDERRLEMRKRDTGGHPDARRLAELSQAARSTAAEIETLLKAHPGLMALVDPGNSDNADDEAASIEAVYLKD